MSGKCRDCRFWDSEYVEDFIEPEGWGNCLHADRKEYPDSSCDVEGIQAWLKTAPDFGCNQFEAKD